MQAPRSLRGLVLVLAVVSATACGMRAQTASPPLVATPVRVAASAPAPAPEPVAAAIPTSTTQAYTPTPLSPPVTLKVATVNATSDAAIFIALDKGYFRDEGITVELQDLPTAAAMIGPLGTGQLDIATGAVAAATFNAAAREVPLRIVADKGSTPSTEWDFNTLMVRRDLIELGQVKDFSDLRGLTISTNASGNATEIQLAKALEKGGLTLDDVHYTPLGFTDMIPAFANRAIDAAMVAEPYIARIETQGTAVRWRGNSDVYGNQQVGVVMYGPGLVTERQEAGRRWMTAYVRGLRDYNDAFGPKRQGRDEVVQILINHTPIKDPKDYDQMRPAGLDPDGKLEVRSIRDDLAYYQRTGLVKDPIDLAKVIDTSFQEFAVLQLGPYER
ncbi:MAG TPA: ABC transporter substrate-binding protein [Chloroflexota bacterium]|jgi:NitT/TauT family transport system substrate-binding protein